MLSPQSSTLFDSGSETRSVRSISSSKRKAARQTVLLAPAAVSRARLTDVRLDPWRHASLLAEAQRLRGRVYLEDGAITQRDLTPDGRFIQLTDDQSWHVLTVNEVGDVVACIRCTFHSEGVSFSDLSVRGSALATHPQWGSRLQEAVERELTWARRRGMEFAEIGGWALDESVRYTTEAPKLIFSVFALAQLFRNGSVGISTATTRHHSSTMLRRAGGQPLSLEGESLPAYFDPHYGCEMEILRFDSSNFSPKYRSLVEDLRQNLSETLTICAASEQDLWTRSLQNLRKAVTHPNQETAPLLRQAS
jgi:hypothetical protein